MRDPRVVSLTALFSTLAIVDESALSSTVPDSDPLLDILGRIQLLASEREADAARFAQGAREISFLLQPVKRAADEQYLDHDYRSEPAPEPRRRSRAVSPPPPSAMSSWQQRAWFCTRLNYALTAAMNACRESSEDKARDEIATCAAKIGEALHLAAIQTA